MLQLRTFHPRLNETAGICIDWVAMSCRLKGQASFQSGLATRSATAVLVLSLVMLLRYRRLGGQAALRKARTEFFHVLWRPLHQAASGAATRPPCVFFEILSMRVKMQTRGRREAVL